MTTDPYASLGAEKIFTLFFVMLGPLKLLGPFARTTKTMSQDELRALALRTGAMAALVAIAGGFVGRAILESWEIPLNVLRLTAGLIFFAVAFQLVLQPYGTAGAEPVAEPGSTMQLVFSMVLTPYGLAIVITQLTLSHATGRTGLVVALLLAIILLDLLAMTFVRRVLRTVGPLLQPLGTILSVLQVALALQVMLVALRGLGVIGGTS
jgi:multiple antibiotic resistance protein